MKRKLLLAFMTVCVLAAALIGSTVAAVDTTSAILTNDVTTPYVNVSIETAVEGDLTTAVELPAQMSAGQTVDLNYVAVNNNADKTSLDVNKQTTNSKITEYVVVTMTKYWKSADGTTDSATDNKLISWVLGTEDWIVLNESDNQVVLLYAKPVTSGEFTSVVLKSITMPKDLTGLKGKSIGLDVTAESVQYIAADGTQETADTNADAIATAYGVKVTVDKTTGAVAMPDTSQVVKTTANP
jgi:hypothetical protein